MRRTLMIPLVMVMALVLVRCGSSGSPSAGGSGTPLPSEPSPTAAPTLPPYHVTVAPADFTNVVTNPYFKLTPGSVRVYRGTKNGVPMQSVFRVLKSTKTIIGVKTAVVQDTVTLNGSLLEKTLDWYAQDSAGNVWYFGEDSKDYKNGVVVSTQGSWLSGVNGGEPGIVMKASPQPGPVYIEEYRPGVAEDMAQVIRSTATLTGPTGSYSNVVVTRNTNPLDPTLLEHKYYAAGVGMVYEVKAYGASNMEIMKLVTLSGL